MEGSFLHHEEAGSCGLRMGGPQGGRGPWHSVQFHLWAIARLNGGSTQISGTGSPIAELSDVFPLAVPRGRGPSLPPDAPPRKEALPQRRLCCEME